MTPDWFEEYDELAFEVVASGYKMLPGHVRRWIDFLDSSDDVSAYLNAWEQAVDFEKWNREAKASVGGMAGSGRLLWPQDMKGRLGLQLALFRRIASGEIDVTDWGLDFFSIHTDFDEVVRQLSDQVFRPFERELRRAISKLDLNARPQDDEAFVPASDRTVALDHNAARVIDSEEKLSAVLDAVKTSNQFSDVDDREQRIAELEASKTLLQARRVRLSAIRTVLWSCLQYLAAKFAEQAIGIAATAALVALAAVFGFHI